MSEAAESIAASADLLHGHRNGGRDWRRAGPLVASALLHLFVLAWLVLPRVPALTPADAPVNVDIVTSSQLASLASAQSSSTAPSSMPPPSSSPASSSEAPSTAASSAPASSAQAASAAASEEPRQASSQPRPRGQPVAGKAGKLVVPVGQADSSSEDASAEASSEASSLASLASAVSEAASAASASAASEAPPNALATATGGGDSIASASAPSEAPPPVGGGTLHPARHFYLSEMLLAPGLAQVRSTLKSLPPARRLAQTCMIEALGQAGHAGYEAEAVYPNVFAPPVASGQTYSASGGAMRVGSTYYRMAYDCTLSPDMSKVTSFSFHIGDNVTQEVVQALGGKN